VSIDDAKKGGGPYRGVPLVLSTEDNEARLLVLRQLMPIFFDSCVDNLKPEKPNTACQRKPTSLLDLSPSEWRD
jgi:hypothetical protein